MEKKITWFRIKDEQDTNVKTKDNYGITFDQFYLKPINFTYYIPIFEIFAVSYFEIDSEIKKLALKLINFNSQFDGQLYGIFSEPFEEYYIEKVKHYIVKIGIAFLKEEPEFVCELSKTLTMNPLPESVTYDNI